MNFAEKKPILIHELQESRTLNRFEIIENNENRLCLYTLQDVYGMKYPCEIRLFMISDNPFTVVTYRFMKGKNSDYPIELLECLNEYNEKYEAFKFYINSENVVVGVLQLEVFEYRMKNGNTKLHQTGIHSCGSHKICSGQMNNINSA